MQRALKSIALVTDDQRLRRPPAFRMEATIYGGELRIGMLIISRKAEFEAMRAAEIHADFGIVLHEEYVCARTADAILQERPISRLLTKRRCC
jgi:hypothetical protein